MALEIFRLMGSVFVDTDKADKSLQSVDKKAQGFGSSLLKGIGTAAKWAAGVAAAAGTAGLALSKMAVDAYADYEQLVGGVETLFGAGGQTFDEYSEAIQSSTESIKEFQKANGLAVDGVIGPKTSAAIVAHYGKLKTVQEDVLKNANEAYRTAGMSANTYLETVTSFSASLIASVGGDTAKAAKLADQAIIDMSDNANKMGTDIGRIQDAYQGFAKQNYGMLDNLKLGYGGTKEEMKRLLKDADAINKQQGKTTKYSLDNLNDVYEAIHVVQTEMGITGTTAKEATSTISGQIGMLKARFDNFKVTLGESLAPVVKSVLSKIIDNLPVIEGLVSGLATGVMKAVDFVMPYLIDALGFVEEWFGKVPELMQVMWDKLTAVGDYLAQLFAPAIEAVRRVFSNLKESVGGVPGAIALVKDKAVEVGGYIADSFQPTLDNLKTIFEAIKDAVQPVIDKFSEYVTSGSAANDATSLFQGAVGLLKGAFDLVAEGCAWVTEKVIEFSNWCSEHSSTVETIAIIVGAFATAWGLVTGAVTAWNAIGVICTAVNTGLSAATTALGAAVAFLTSPIGIAIAAIGAIIAIGVLLWQNWDTIKAKATEIWTNLSAKFSQIKQTISQAWDNVKQATSQAWDNVKQSISDAWENIKRSVSTAVSGVWSSITSVFNNVWTTVSNIWSNIQKTITDKITAAKDTVKEIVDSIVGFFAGAKFSWPSIPMPHFGISPSGWRIGDLLEGVIPKLDISWYKKAYDQAMILDNPTLFGYSPATGKALGGGEGNGNEVVVGEAHLIGLIDKVVARHVGASSSALSDALLLDIRDLMEKMAGAGIYLDTGALVGAMAKPMDKKLGQLQVAKGRA